MFAGGLSGGRIPRGVDAGGAGGVVTGGAGGRVVTGVRGLDAPAVVVTVVVGTVVVVDVVVDVLVVEVVAAAFARAVRAAAPGPVPEALASAPEKTPEFVTTTTSTTASPTTRRWLSLIQLGPSRCPVAAGPSGTRLSTGWNSSSTPMPEASARRRHDLRLSAPKPGRKAASSQVRGLEGFPGASGLSYSWATRSA